ncbi:hypothetical protein pdam_00015502 [Paramuricea clavata]|uniref:Uncharacterized protein n=1 Tax=Paramuricea clavata TaxID=317549 RepID=A0A7D9D8I5_PARCT|nr:hypothetical protein pdam_00015502 [Paramuricea clavata]
MESLRTRINGFTAWINLRLAPSGVFMHNVLEDILKGKNMKILLESMTGKPLKKLQSFDGLTQQQKITRVEWMLRELKENNIILPEVKIDTQMFTMRSSTQVFELLWCLVCHDIWYVWEKSFTLQQTGGRELFAEPFSWVPSSSTSDTANVPYERLVFRDTKQSVSETVEQYITRLRQKARTCEFGETCEEQIRDQVIIGCISHNLRPKLLQKGGDLNLTQLRDMARAMENAEKQAGDIEGRKGVNRVWKKAGRQQERLA